MAKSQKRSNPAIRQLNPDVPHPAAGLKGKPDLTARPPVPDNKGQMRGDSTARPLRVAFIGNALPRRCGIATFTTDLEQAVSALPEVADTAIIAMCDPGGNYAWPPSVRFCIDQNDSGQYLAAANFINTNGFDVACLQHEFGIYGGDAGGHVLGLIAGLKVPLVTTLHTVLDAPTPAQRVVMNAIIAASAQLVVMAVKGREILIETYRAHPDKIAIIPHGIPETPFESSRGAKQRLGYADRKVILTFGLISPSKGIETMIEAMPAIVATAPEAVYVVMGATHPHLLRDAGEAYRESLAARARALGLEDHVIFLNRFAERPALLEHISACDIYVTPYLVAAQLTSGTLAYSHGLGRPVVSTPYWHAAELLADGSGVLVPFGDCARLGEAVAHLLDDEPARLAMGAKAYAASRPTVWANTATRYAATFRSATRMASLRIVGGRDTAGASHRPSTVLPEMSNRHFITMCDDTGIFQHAIHTIPDRHHGYCVDDNARALLLCCTAGNRLGAQMETALTMRFAAFVQHAWNPDNKRFRNFMGYSRDWLEPAGSEDSHGRTLWALGACARRHADTPLGEWAAGLFRAALPTVERFTAPRSWAFTLLGLDCYCHAHPGDRQAATMRTALADRLAQRFSLSATPDWTWFENRLAYDNARLCEALIRTGMATGASDLVDTGLASLRWLMAMQTAPAGHFRPIGSQGFLLDRQPPLPFDQQPLEAAATIAACAAAAEAEAASHASGHSAAEAGNPWPAEADRAFAWFLGKNDLGIPLVDTASGVCLDGLHPDRANQNSGAESVLSWLLALADMRALANTQSIVPPRPAQPAPPILPAAPLHA